jgi:hypothetical protein
MNDNDILEMQQKAGHLVSSENPEDLDSLKQSTSIEVGDTSKEERERALKLMDNVEEQQQEQEDGEASKEETEPTQEELIKQLQQELQELKESKSKEEEALQDESLKPIEEKAKEKDVDIEAYKKEYILSGELSEESLKALEDSGFTKEAIDAYITAKTYQEQKKAVKIMEETVGSEDNYMELIEWISSNKSQEEIAEYDEGVNSKYAKHIIKAMYNEMQQATKGHEQEPQHRTLRGRPSSSNEQEGTVGFKSQAEMMRAMQDPSYGVDEKYTQLVRKKVMMM